MHGPVQKEAELIFKRGGGEVFPFSLHLSLSLSQVQSRRKIFPARFELYWDLIADRVYQNDETTRYIRLDVMTVNRSPEPRH